MLCGGHEGLEGRQLLASVEGMESKIQNRKVKAIAAGERFKLKSAKR
jgi:hypothetical protein